MLVCQFKVARGNFIRACCSKQQEISIVTVWSVSTYKWCNMTSVDCTEHAQVYWAVSLWHFLSKQRRRKRDKRCNAGESRSLSSVLTLGGSSGVFHSLSPLCVSDDYSTEHRWQLQMVLRQKELRAGSGLFSVNNVTMKRQEGQNRKTWDFTR